MMRENPVKGCTGKTENGRESGFSKRKRRRNNSDNKVARRQPQHGEESTSFWGIREGQ